MPELSLGVWLGCLRYFPHTVNLYSAGFGAGTWTWFVFFLFPSETRALRNVVLFSFFFSTWCSGDADLLAVPGQGCARKPNSAQAEHCCPFCIFLGMLSSPAVSTLADDVRAVCVAALAQACSHQSVWKTHQLHGKRVSDHQDGYELEWSTSFIV